MYYFIVNPNSKSGKGKNIWNKVKVSLNNNSIKYKAYFTEYRNHATEIAKTISTDAKNTVIIILGGDGTINEVINGIDNIQSTTVGYIPTGSCNDFARSFKISSSPLDIINNILNNKYYIRKIDFGHIKFSNNTKYKFAGNAGIGLDASICKSALDAKYKILLNKLCLGKLTYIFAFFQTFFRYKPSNATIATDSETLHFNNVYLIAFNIIPYEGGGMKMCPMANAYDGKLDLCIVHNISKLKILILFPFIFGGKHTKFKGVSYFQVKQAIIKTSKPMQVHSDGESLGTHSYLNISCKEQKLPFIVPA